MALDTENKRLSAINSRSTGRRTLPLADGTIDQSDRLWLLRLYSGISAQNVAVPDLCYPLYLIVPVQPGASLVVTDVLTALTVTDVLTSLAVTDVLTSLVVTDVAVALGVTTTGETVLVVQPCD